MTAESESQGPDPEMINAETCHEEIELLVILVTGLTVFSIFCFLFCITKLLSEKNQRVKNKTNHDLIRWVTPKELREASRKKNYPQPTTHDDTKGWTLILLCIIVLTILDYSH